MLAIGLTIALLFLKNIAADQYVVPPAALKATGYQRWAHYHWVWLKNSEINQANITALIKGYKDNNIPVGAVNIDSTWATQFNNFVVDTTKFADFPGLVSDIHKANMKVILWATSMVNTENPDYEMAVKNQYLLRDSRGIVRPIKWWHGEGGLLDYSNPEALAWWHGLMDQVLDVGVDGFKCDATAPYVLEYSIFGGAKGYNNQTVTYPDYAKAYYRDFFYHTRERRAPDTGVDSGLIMARPVDCLVDPPTKVCQPNSPKDVMYSGWVGDDDATMNGLRGCMRKLIYSSWLGYANFGCDVGGYRGGSDTKSKTEYLRWAQAMAFMPLMENGGGGEHRPWMYEDTEVTDIYRKFAVEHHKLVAYMFTNGANAMDSGTSAIHPVDQGHFPHPEDTSDLTLGRDWVFPQPTTYSYRLGADVLVHPVLWDIANTEKVNFVEMTFPDTDGDASTTDYWLDWWNPLETRKMRKSGDVVKTAVALGDYPVYVRAGAFVPLVQQARPSDDLTDITNQRVVFTWFAPTNAQDADHKAVFNMRESVTEGAGITATAYFSDATTVQATISAHTGTHAGFQIVGINEPTDVKLDFWLLSVCVHEYVGLTKTLSVSCAHIDGGVSIRVEGVTSAVF